MRENILYKIIIASIFFLLSASCSDGEKDSGKEGQNPDGSNIVETGELAAVNSKSFILPRYSRSIWEMKIIGILEHGTIVNAGDSIIQLDPTEINKYILDRETNLETQMATLQKMQVDQNNKNNESESKIKSELASFDLKKIELESSRFESEKFRKIKQLEFRQAEITLAKEKKKRELSRIIDENDLKIQEIRVRQIKDEIESSYKILPLLTIRTSSPGVFQRGRNPRMWPPVMLKVGDNVYPGSNMANVPELTWMKVNTYINEADFLKIHVGQKVAVRLDAMPNVVFDGEITYIGKLCHLRDANSKSRQKVFDVEVNVLEPDERLKPGMTVSCEFLQNT